MRIEKKCMFMLICCLLLPFSVFAADKVVVIPLNTGAKQTQPDQYITRSSLSIDPGTHSDVYTPPCPAGYRLTGGGFLWDVWATAEMMVGSRPVMGENRSVVSGANAADRYLCQGNNTNVSVAATLYCYSVCILVPGR